MTREEMVMAMEWLAPDSGVGFGVCRVGNMMAWAMATPSENVPDLKSIVAISGSPEMYTDEEIAALYAFHKRHTDDYDTRWTQRMGANLIIIGKQDWHDKWLRKRQSWDMGKMFSDTLEEAMEVFDRDLDSA